MNRLLARCRCAVLAAPTLLLLAAFQLPSASGQDPERTAKASVADALRVAAKKNKRVLIVWGHDAGDGHPGKDRKLGRSKPRGWRWPIYYDFEIVAVDRGSDGKLNSEFAESLGATASGPSITVLNSEGQPLANRDTEEFLDKKSAWNIDRLGSFLSDHIPESRDADEIMQTALERAKQDKKRLLVHLGAPW